MSKNQINNIYDEFDAFNDYDDDDFDIILPMKKLEPNQIYNIIQVTKIKTKYGDNYKLWVNSKQAYWPNTKIKKFLDKHKDKLFQIKHEHGYISPVNFSFVIKTFDEKEFSIIENNKKKIIKYFDVKLYKTMEEAKK